MLASLTMHNDDVVKVSLPDGRKIVGQCNNFGHITVIENTTNLDEDIAECVAGVALSRAVDHGDDTIVWRRLVDLAHRCHKELEASKWRLN